MDLDPIFVRPRADTIARIERATDTIAIVVVLLVALFAVSW